MAEAQPPDRTHAAATRIVPRRDFEQIIRRASELSSVSGDADDQLTEEEVIRIAGELGLAPEYVKQALFELPELTAPAKWYDRRFGSPIFSVSRVVPGQAPTTLRRIEDYLVTREYLQIVRKRGESMAFVPAEDALSNVARALLRPSRRHPISRASRVVASVNAMPGEQGHVRFDVDLSDARRESVQSGIVIGTLTGFVTGGLAAGIVVGLVPATAIDPAPAILAFTGGMAATIGAAYSMAASGFRNRVFAAKLELTGLLDRLEHGDRLEPPPAPWRRRLFGHR